MDFFFQPGKQFAEEFVFKNESGKTLSIPPGEYRLVLTRGTFGREYKRGSGLVFERNKIVWSLSPEETSSFEFSTLYYTLYWNDTELARGVLKSV